ncbi:hypothetical protein SDC9_83130 [bioreactor metagenome]|uniref:Uncharacterized protein n=1 Tax=bioreactor metagenome TaxID=1076179 RepID=A0A644Z6U2_9ZZZZ
MDRGSDEGLGVHGLVRQSQYDPGGSGGEQHISRRNGGGADGSTVLVVRAAVNGRAFRQTSQPGRLCGKPADKRSRFLDFGQLIPRDADRVEHPLVPVFFLNIEELTDGGVGRVDDRAPGEKLVDDFYGRKVLCRVRAGARFAQVQDLCRVERWEYAPAAHMVYIVVAERTLQLCGLLARTGVHPGQGVADGPSRAVDSRHARALRGDGNPFDLQVLVAGDCRADGRNARVDPLVGVLLHMAAVGEERVALIPFAEDGAAGVHQERFGSGCADIEADDIHSFFHLAIFRKRFLFALLYRKK